MRRIGFLAEMNRIESDRNGLNRADWIESETTKIGLTGLNRTERVVRADLNRNRFSDCIAHAWRQ